MRARGLVLKLQVASLDVPLCNLYLNACIVQMLLVCFSIRELRLAEYTLKGQNRFLCQFINSRTFI